MRRVLPGVKLLWLGWLLVGCSCSVETPDAVEAERPNIVLIFADDLGYADLGIHGSRDILTPNIDRLAREGVRCTSGSVTAPQCTPTRAGILTGRSQCRFGMEMNVPPKYSVSEEERLAGLEQAAELDGVDLTPYFCGEVSAPAPRTLFWRFGEQRALRRGDWKYYSYLDEVRLLFDLSKDPGERRNLAAERPELLTELRALHAEWERELMEPLWDTPMNHTARLRALRQRYALGK